MYVILVPGTKYEEDTMEKIFDKIILLLCCSILLMSSQLSLYTVIPILTVIWISSLINFFNKDNITILAFIFYVGLCIVSPNFIFFLPLLCYDLVCETYRYTLFIGIFAILRAAWFISPFTIFLLLALTILAYLLKRRNLALSKSKEDYFIMRDNMMEFADQLQIQNKDLLEKQDYEVSNATLNERNRIAREIHDTVGHLLSSSILQIGAMLAITKDEIIKENLSDIKETLAEGMNSIRSSIHNIHDNSIDLESKIEELIDDFTFCRIKFSYNINHDFTTKAKYSIIFIVKEALSNVMKHSSATMVTITINEFPGFYQIVIQDNGGKKKAEAFPKDSSGMGIQSMLERINNLEGHFHVDSNKGYKIFITLPKSKEANNDI